MKSRLQQFLKSPKGKLTAALSVLLLVWLVLLLNFSRKTGNLLPGEDDIKALEREAKKEKAEYDAQNLKLRDLSSLKKRYQEQTELCWNEARDGDVETVLRDLVEVAAKNAEVTLSSLGSVRTSKINTELYYAELEFTVSEGYEKVLKFMAQVEAAKPTLYWHRAELRPEFMPMRPQESSTSTTAKVSNRNSKTMPTVTEQKLRFSGSIRVIGFDKTKDAGGK